MTNKLAIGIGIFILGLFLIDLLVFGGNSPLFIARKLFALTEYLAFWR